MSDQDQYPPSSPSSPSETGDQEFVSDASEAGSDTSPSLSELLTVLETKLAKMETLRSEYNSTLFGFESARQMYKEVYANENPEDPIPDLDTFPDSETLQTELDVVKVELERAQLEREFLERKRESRQSKLALENLQATWDEAHDGPVPEFPTPLVPIDEEDDRTEHERLLAAFSIETKRIREELDAYRATVKLLDTTKDGIRKRAARARASGSIDPVGFYTDLEAHFGDSIGLSPGNLMNVQARDEKGRTPLMCVVHCDLGSSEPHPERLGRTNTLLGMGSDVDAKDNDGNTALAFAASEPDGEPELVRLLIAHGADPFSKDNDGKTVLEKARSFALRAILFGSTGELRHRISKTLTGDQAKKMQVFVEDPEGAAELFQELLHRFG